MQKKTKTTSVIIPFYQEKSGLLRRAVESIFDQTGVSDVHVVVADDGCPIHARDELKNVIVPEGFSLIIVRQPNRGPGAARNLALENISQDTEHIAFLDSDDFWYPEHLKRALSALYNGADLYFSPCDFENERQQINACTSFREFVDPLESTAIQDTPSIRICRHLPLEWYIKSPGKIITPSVVVNMSRAPNLRFREDLPNGQDIAFFMDYFRCSQKVGFSMETEVKVGRGINIWAGANHSPFRSANVRMNERLMLRTLYRDWRDKPDLAKIIKRKIASVKRDIANIFYKQTSLSDQWKILKRVFNDDKSVFLAILQAPFQAFRHKVSRLYKKLTGNI